MRAFFNLPQADDSISLTHFSCKTFGQIKEHTYLCNRKIIFIVKVLVIECGRVGRSRPHSLFYNGSILV